MIRVLFCSVATSMLVAAPALAAEDSNSGFRAEARLGYDAIKLSVDYDDGVDQFSDSASDNGLLYGVEVGYDFDFGGQFVGPYASFDLSSTKECYADTFESYCLKARRNIAAGIRAGIGHADSLRGYVKVGYVSGRMRGTYEDFEDSSFNFSDAASRDGLQVGVGLEYPLGKGAYGKVEYLYNDYKDFDIDPPVLTGDFTRHQAVAGIGIKF